MQLFVHKENMFFLWAMIRILSFDSMVNELGITNDEKKLWNETVVELKSIHSMMHLVRKKAKLVYVVYTVLNIFTDTLIGNCTILEAVGKFK